MTQSEALAILESGRSVLLTGAAGTGKTYLLNHFISRAKRAGKHVAVTATTGLAASHLGGTTIHAWSGIGVADSMPPERIKALSASRKQTIAQADILVIDEISMLHDYRLDMVDAICRQVRDNDESFGGLQVVLCGDFFQLPPVSRLDSRPGGFVTHSQAWQSGNFGVLYLHKQQRQRDDVALTELLNAIRRDAITPDHRRSLQARLGTQLSDAITPTRLHTTNIDVDEINMRELAKLTTEERNYAMTTTGRKQYVETLKRSCLAPEILKLKVGALVMCVKNSQAKLYVNGSLGEVVGFDNDTGWPVVRLTSNERRLVIGPESWELVDGQTRRAKLTQLPLRLAWALTVHKSQGMTLDAAEVNLSRTFAPGMGYVALSRVRSLDHLTLSGFGPRALEVSTEARDIDMDLRRASEALRTESAELFAAAAKAWEKEKLAVDSQPKDKQPNTSNWSEKIEKMRETYPNAYRPWASDDDDKLKVLFESGQGLQDLTQAFGRHPGSIRSRIRKHFGDDAAVRA